jgi:hypothetical protein
MERAPPRLHADGAGHPPAHAATKAKGQVAMRITITLTALALLACGPSAEQRRARDARTPCYDEAEAATQRRIDAECPGPFASCPTAAEIVEELRLAQERCP